MRREKGAHMRNKVIILVASAGLLTGFVLWFTRSDSTSAEEHAQQERVTGAGLESPGISSMSPTVSATPEREPILRQVLADPIVVGPCNLFPVAEQDVSSQVDGVLREFLADLGKQVNQGELLARLDDRQVRTQVDLLKIKASSRAAELIAKAMYDEANAKVKYAEDANMSGLKAVSDLEHQSYLFQRERFTNEIKKAREDREAAARELEKASLLLDLHQLRSALSGEVIKVYKRQGEAVKQAEPLFRVANFHKLRVEGLCKASQAATLRVGMPVIVEPETRSEPLTSLNGHTAPVHGLAITGDGRLLASASEDRTVLLWRWPQATRLAQLPHPSGVYAVAFTPVDKSGQGYRLLTAGADGLARLWTISAKGEVQGPAVLPRVHDGALRAVAFSPDGKWFATAGEDRRVGIWELGTKKFLYWVQISGEKDTATHQGAVTSVHFTSDQHLVSAGRDNTLKVWKLGGEGARLVRQQAGRTGDVLQLGVSPDGQELLFDHGEELRILRRSDGLCLGTLQSRKQGHFQGLALFSPKGRLIVTAANNSRLQLWKVPTTPAATTFFRAGYTHGFHRGSLTTLAALNGMATHPYSLTGLGNLSVAWADLAPGSSGTLETKPFPRLWGLDSFEVRHFATPNMVVHCGAFAPDESVVFTAGTDKVIRVWQVPSEQQWAIPLEGRLTFVGSQVECGTDMVRIRAEVDNPTDPGCRLRPGMAANLRLYPETISGK